MKKAFTLAEILIVITVIGIISAIIMPVAFHATPDKNVIKFKKIDSALRTAVSNLVLSDKFYKDGDFGITADGEILDENNTSKYEYFCRSLADSLLAQQVNCSIDSCTDLQKCAVVYNFNVSNASYSVTADLDNICANNLFTGPEIILKDNVTIYQTAAGIPFASSGRLLGGVSNQRFLCTDNCLDMYKVVCVDIDGMGRGEPPFGYGIRADGKILSGPKAVQWYSKKLQKE